MLVDIDRPPADVRSGLAQKWRNHLNNARAAGRPRDGGRDPSLFRDFTPLFDELVARKSLAVDLGADFYARLQPRLADTERLHLAIARLDGRPAAGVVARIHGDTAVYLLGASNDLGRATNAAYLLQWKVIEAASRAACRRYDLGGGDPEGNPGLYRFKQSDGRHRAVRARPVRARPGSRPRRRGARGRARVPRRGAAARPTELRGCTNAPARAAPRSRVWTCS